MNVSPVPAGRAVELAGRGTTWVRETGTGHPGPPLVLLHGWTVTADLNWSAAYETLGRHHRVIAIDLRGHGRGIRSAARFRLEDCAADVAALADALDLGPIVPVGYSMGGLIAQLLWRDHRDQVAGLVLASTARNFKGGPGDRLYFAGLSGLATATRLAPEVVRQQLFERYLGSRLDDIALGEWAAEELGRSDLLALTEAGAAIGNFASHDWIGGVDVPTAVVVTEDDTTVPTQRQHKLAAAISRAVTFSVAGDHHAVAREPLRYVPVLLDACDYVVGRSAEAPP